MKLLTKLKNANLVKKNYLFLKFKKQYFFTLRLLTKYKYIHGFIITIKKKYILLIIYLRYKGTWVKTATLYTIRQISKPGQQIFFNHKKSFLIVKNVKYQSGLGIISSFIGIVSAYKAHKYKIGGEYLYYFN